LNTLTHPTPIPSERAANHRFCTAQQVEYTSVSRMELRPSTSVPDVIVWDVSWETSNAVNSLGLLPEDAPPVLALAVTSDQAAQARAAGAQALLSRDASPEALAAAAVALSHGLQVTDPALAGVSAAATPEPGSASLLTPKEQDVLKLLAEGLPNKGVVSRLEVSEHTVKFHVNSIMGKLNAQSRTEAVILATRLGLLPL